MDNLLKNIDIFIPSATTVFKKDFLDLFSGIGRIESDKVLFSSTDKTYYPKQSFRFDSSKEACAVFTSENDVFKFVLNNETGEEWKSPYSYKPISIKEVKKRLKGLKPTKLDHVGFNLPWKSKECHPQIETLRKQLAGRCLYHLYPGNMNWDFILPGTGEEILNQMEVDYIVERRPKFELVSFQNSSTPLVQFEVLVDAKYEDFAPLFPEAIQLPKFKNLWIYLKNDSGVDLCLVLNEDKSRDWSKFFSGRRLKSDIHAEQSKIPF